MSSLKRKYLELHRDDPELPQEHNEQRIGEAVIAWLRANDWEVFQEVKASKGDARAPVADIVAHRHNYVWIIECKRHLGLEVLDQLIHWQRRGFADYYSAATFTPWAGVGDSVGHLVHHFGFGLIRASRNGESYDANIDREAPMQLRDPTWDSIEDYLDIDQQTRLKAGSKGGDVSTPFTRTCDQLRELVEAGPIAAADAVRAITHHYNSDSAARNNLTNWAMRGSIRGVRIKRKGRFLYFAKAAP